MPEWIDTNPVVDYPDSGDGNQYDTPSEFFDAVPEFRFLNQLTGGQYEQQTEANYYNPNFDTDWQRKQEEEYQRQLEEANREARLANRRRQVDLEMDQVREEPDLWTRAGLGIYQAGLGFGRAVGGLEEATGLDRLGLEGGLAGGLLRRGESLAQTTGREMADVESLTEHRGAPTAGDFVQKGIELLGGLVPVVAGGLPAVAGQVFGSTFANAKDRYIANGFTEGQAQARAYVPSAISAALSYFIWHQFGTDGARALERGLNADTVSDLLTKIVTGAGKTASASGIDTLSQDIVAKATYEPEKPIADIIADTFSSAAVGGLLGASTEGALAGLNGALRRGRQTSTQGEPNATQARQVEESDQQQYSGDASQLQTNGQVGQLPPEVDAQSAGAGSGSGLPQGARLKTAGVKILKALGATDDVAKRFVDHFTANAPAHNTLEEYRANLMQAFLDSGLIPENRVSLFRENPLDYEGTGQAPEEALRTVEDAKVANEKTRQEARAKNEEILKALEPKLTPEELKQLSALESKGQLNSDEARQLALLQNKQALQGSLGQPQEPTGPPTPPKPPAYTVKDFIAQVDQSNLPDQTKQMFRYASELPALKDLDWQGVSFKLTGQQRPGGVFDSAVLDRGFQFSDFSKGEDLVHEVAHILERALPEDARAKLEQLRMEAIKEKYGDNVPEHLVDGTLTSEAFLKSGLPTSDYHLINTGEFIANFAGNRFAQDFAAKTHGKTFVEKVKGWFKGVWDAVARTVSDRSANQQRRTAELNDFYNRFIGGEIKPEVERLSPEIRGAYRATSEEALYAKELSKTPEEKEVEGWHLLGQSTDILKNLVKHGAQGVTLAAQKLLDFHKFIGINQYGQDLHGSVEDYRTLKSKITNPWQRNFFSSSAAKQMRDFSNRLDTVQQEYAERLKEITSPAFVRKKAKDIASQGALNVAEAVNKASGPYLQSALKMAQKALTKEGLSDLKIAELQGRIAQIEQASQSPAGMKQVFEDIVNKLNSTPEGQAILADPSAAKRSEIADVYRDIKRSVGEPMTNDTLINIAGEILKRNDSLRDDLLAAQLSRNSAVRKAMGPYQTKMLADLEKDMPKTIAREVRLGKKLQSDEDKARFVWLRTHKDVLKTEQEYAKHEEAAQVANAIKNDPDFKALKKEIYNDASFEGEKKSFQPGVDKTFLMPDGKTEVSVDLGKLRGKVSQAQWAEWDKARDDLKKWLNDKANADDPNYDIHERNLFNLEANFNQENVLSPHDREHLFTNGLNSVLNAVRNAGGPIASVIQKQIAKLDILKFSAATWLQRYRNEWFAPLVKAMKSHNLKWDTNGGKEPMEVVNNRFYEDHINEIAYSRNRQAGALQVGDVTGSGMKVTQEDLDFIRSMANASKSAYDIVKRNTGGAPEGEKLGGEDFYLYDYETGNVIQKKPTQGTEDYMPRKFRNDWDDFIKSYDAAKTPAEKIKLLNDNWDKLVYQFVSDRDPNFAQPTPFDGRNGAFEQIADDIKGGAMVPDFKDLTDRLANLSGATTAEAQDIVLEEWGRMIHDRARQMTDEAALAQDPVTGTRKNSFTKGRGKQVLPFGFYDYGFRDSKAINSFATMIHSRAHEQLIHSLATLRDNITDRMRDLSNTADKLARSGAKNPTSEAIAMRNRERANGENFEHWNKLDDIYKDIDGVIKSLVLNEPTAETDTAAARIFGGVSGNLVANIGTATRNMVESDKYLGLKMTQLGTKPLIRRPMIWYHIYLDAALKGALSGLYGASKAGLIGSIPVALRVARALSSKIGIGKPRNVSEAFLPLINEMAVKTFERLKTLKQMQALGVERIEAADAQFNAMMAGGYARAGELNSQANGRLMKTVNRVMGPLEAFLHPWKVFTTVMSESIVNQAIQKSIIEGKFGHVAEMEAAGRKIAEAFQKSGYRRFDFDNPASPVNEFSTKEVFPGLLNKFKNEFDLPTLKSEYQAAGLDFQTEMMKYLKAIIVDRIPNPRFLESDSARARLSNHVTGEINRNTMSRQPTALKGRGAITQALKPLLGWMGRTGNFINTALFSRPATLGKNLTPRQIAMKKAKFWAVMATTTILPTILSFALSAQISRAILHPLKKLVWNQESSDRYPWEYEGAKSQAFHWTTDATYGLPFVDKVMNAMLNDTPTRASLDPSFVMVNKAKDIFNYVGGAVQTGDPTFHLPQLIESFVPDSRIVLNRIESEAGKRLGSDIVALARQNGPQDILKPSMGVPTAPNYTELSPFGPAMENAALSGNMGEFRRLYDEAVAKATEMGRPDPERLVKQLFMARNPLTRAFSQKLSDEQLQTFLGKMSQDERQKVEGALDKFREAASSIGANFTETKEEKEAGTGGGSAPSYQSRSGRSETILQSRISSPRISTLRRGKSTGLGSLKAVRTRAVRLTRSRSLGRRTRSVRRGRSRLRRARR